MSLSRQLLAIRLMIRDVSRAVSPQTKKVGRVLLSVALCALMFGIAVASLAWGVVTVENALPFVHKPLAAWPLGVRHGAEILAADLAVALLVFGGVLARNVLWRKTTPLDFKKHTGGVPFEAVFQLTEKPLGAPANLSLIVFAAVNAFPLGVAAMAWMAVLLGVVIVLAAFLGVLTVGIWLIKAPERARARMEKALEDNPVALAEHERKQMLRSMGVSKSGENYHADSAPCIKKRRL